MSLVDDIKATITIADPILEKVIEQFQSKTFNKSDLIPSFRKVSNHMQFIKGGLVRIYTIDKQGKEITIQIGIENMWINDLYSYFTQTPSENRIEVLEPTTILQIHRNDLENLYKEVPMMSNFFHLKLEKSYVRLYNRAIRQLNQSAEERYLEFKSKYGTIENRVPQYIIASYLNISPEHLSKVRNQLAKK